MVGSKKYDLAINQHTHCKLLYIVNKRNGSLSNVPKSEFPREFSMSMNLYEFTFSIKTKTYIVKVVFFYVLNNLYIFF